MGCGAMCGDNVLVNTSSPKCKIAFQKILASLQNNNTFSQTQHFQLFHQAYLNNPDYFYLHPPPKLIPNQQLPHQILLKWKMVLYGQDSNEKVYINCLRVEQNADSYGHENSTSSFLKHPPFYHQCFKQIQKDLDRTFALPEQSKPSFQKILKRIAVYFPKMGYTQGINFMIGYLIIIGYSQQECFWMFVRLALNRRFLLLGLYEEGFPLVNVLMGIFSKALRRQYEQVFNHLIVQLEVDTSQWVFKWFITCYLYSFPRQLIKYIWDLIIHLGNLGIVSFAIALIQEIHQPLLQIIEIADISQFFDSLKDIHAFNHHVDLNRLIKHAYTFTFNHSDFQGLENTAPFYGIHLNNTFLQQQAHSTFSKRQSTQVSREKGEGILDEWYQQILRERLKFMERLVEGIGQSEVKQVVGEVVQKQVSMDEYTVQLGNAIRHKQRSIQQRNGAFNDAQQNRIQYIVDNIKENVEEEENSIRSSISNTQPIPTTQFQSNVINMDQLDTLHQQFNAKHHQHQHTYRNQHQEKHYPSIKTTNQANTQQAKLTFQRIKINNYANIAGNSLSIAGLSSLRTQKMDNSLDAISVSSKHATSRSKKKGSRQDVLPGHLPSSVGNRICSCKIRTQEHKKQIGDQNSEFSESKEQFSEKDSSKNELSQHEKSVNQNYSIQNMQSERVRKTDEDYMANSHGPHIIDKQLSVQNIQKKLGREKSEVDIQLITFKKDKRNRVEKMCFVEVNKRMIGWENEEESLESLKQICMEKDSNGTSRRSQSGNNYEIQSIR